MLYLQTLGVAVLLATVSSATISLGEGGAYGAFAASAITNTGSTIIKGRLGITPGTSITGFPPGESTGEDIDTNNATTAKSDLQSCYNALKALTTTDDLPART